MLAITLLFATLTLIDAFTPSLLPSSVEMLCSSSCASGLCPFSSCTKKRFRREWGVVLYSAIDVSPPEEDDNDDEEEDQEVDGAYSKIARSEFVDTSTGDATTAVDWGGALGKLRERIGDVQKGGGGISPSTALFRSMTRDSPNEAITRFLQEAKPDVIGAMTGAVMSLLGGLSNPAIGVETIVKANGEKLGNLCFQVSNIVY